MVVSMEVFPLFKFEKKLFGWICSDASLLRMYYLAIQHMNITGCFFYFLLRKYESLKINGGSRQ